MGQNVRRSGLNKVFFQHIFPNTHSHKNKENVNCLQECGNTDIYTLAGPTLSYIHRQVTSQTGNRCVPVKGPGRDNFVERTL